METKRILNNCIFAQVLNGFGAQGATFGKATIAIHRYFVIRSRDFAEKASEMMS